MLDAEDREVTVPINSIEERTTGGSLMPEGLSDPLTRPELVDLVRFLSELGKVGPYSVGKSKLVRRWQVLEPTPAAYSLLSRNSFTSSAGGDPSLTWTPAYSKIDGTLPMVDLPAFKFRKPESNSSASVGFVRFQLDVSTAGKILLRFNSTTDTQLWVDGVPATAGRETVMDLKVGVHTLTLSVNLDQRREALSCELDDAAGSSARATIVGGK